MNNFEKSGIIELSDLEHLKYLESRIYKKYIINEPPSIPMKLEMPELEKAIQKGNENAQSKSQTPKKRITKNDSKTKSATVARIQKKL